MKPSRTAALIFIVTTIFIGCSTGKKALQRGDYYEATIQAVKFLRSNPDSEKARETIIQSYPMALEYYRQKVDEISNSNTQDKYFSIVEIYTKLNNLADEISRCPAALNAVKPVVYFHEQLNLAQELAIAEQYETGLQLMKSGYIEDARTAVQKFEWVSKTKPGYSDVNRKMAEAEEKATLK
jgi:tetratricopeptide (TPR) repeat protein